MVQESLQTLAWRVELCGLVVFIYEIVVLVHPKILILSLITHPHVILNL